MSADLIARFGRTITVRSALSAGDYVNGMWQEPLTEEIQIVASVQRLTPKEVLLLKEADRQKESFKLYSTYQFKVQKDGTMEKSDYVLIDGKQFMVVSCEDWMVNQAMTIKYYRVVS